MVITLEPRKWLHGVENTACCTYYGYHISTARLTIFIIRQLLCLVHDGYLWLEEPITITTDLIHYISWLPCKGKDLATIAEGKGNDLALTEAMKVKYKLEKKKRGYAISNIKEKWVRVATQLLAGKVMRKCHTNEVPALVVALAKQRMEGV